MKIIDNMQPQTKSLPLNNEYKTKPVILVEMLTTMSIKYIPRDKRNNIFPDKI